MIDRRTFLASVTGGLLAAPLVAEAQQAGKVHRLGQLGPGPPNCYTPFHPAEIALRRGLEEAGYVVDRNIAIERRCFSRMEDLTEVTRALVDTKIDILVVFSAPGALAAKRATQQTPIVFIDAGEVVANGLVNSLAKPGGNATGLTSITYEIVAKRVELLREAVPSARRIAILANPASAGTAGQMERIRAAANPLGLTLSVIELSSVSDFGRAAADLKRDRPEALLVLVDAFFFVQQQRVVSLANDARVPAMYSHTNFVQSGGLVAYAADINDMARRAASYVDLIIKGGNPADLPVEQPTKFELVINLRTAKALGLTILPSLLLRADQTIE